MVTPSEAQTPTRKPNRVLNIAANYVGVLSTLLVQIFLVPVYVRILGAESYGIIGFFMMLQSVLQVMDLGFGMALNRELARRSDPTSVATDTKDLVRSLEVLSWLVGITLGALIFGASDLLSVHWLTAVSLPQQSVATAIALMGMALAFQWPQSIYHGGLLGLQMQGRAVAITAGANVTFAIGAIVLLMLFPRIETFFIWRSCVSLTTAVVQRQVLWQNLPERHASIARPRFRWDALKPVFAFSVGMTGITITGITLVQLDKVVISRFVTLDRYGAYMLASTAAALIPQMASPIFSAMLPALSQAFGRDDRIAQQAYFRLASRLVATLVVPIALAVACYSESLLVVWTGDSAISESGAPVLSMLASGALLNSIMVPCYAVQVAGGWTRLAMKTNIVLITLMPPYAVLASSTFGALGAASTWLFLNAVYLGMGARLTLQNMLPGTANAWLRVDLAPPLFCSLLLIGLARCFVPVPDTRVGVLALVSTLTLATIGANVLLNADLRARGARLLSQLARTTQTNGS